MCDGLGAVLVDGLGAAVLVEASKHKHRQRSRSIQSFQRHKYSDVVDRSVV